MLNRAKCKLCQDIIESYHSTDYVTCKCSEIALDGGEAMLVFANDLSNIIRVDDKGNEIIPKIVSRDTVIPSAKPNRDDLIAMLDSSIAAYENLPEHALNAPVTHADMINFMMIVQAILKAI